MGLLVSQGNSTKNFGKKQEKQRCLKESIKFEDKNNTLYPQGAS